MTYTLQVVIIKKNPGISFDDAKKTAQHIIKDNNKKYYRETTESWRFRNIPKTQFVKNSFKTKVINKHVSLVFGELK
jgi:hypothetical protein